MSPEFNNNEQVVLYQQNGDIVLRNEIVLKNMSLVRSCAMSMRNMYIKFCEPDDVVNEGVIALMDAIESFDPSKGAKFETYATIKIKGAVIDYIRKQDWVPRSIRKFAKELDKANSMLYNLNGRVPTSQELAEHLGISENTLLKNMAECSGTIVFSFEELLYEDNIDEPAMENPTDKALLHSEMKRVIAQAIDGLKEKERQVIILYYYKNLKYSDIAKVLGVTEGRICQIHTKAVLTLKARLFGYFMGGESK